MVQSNDQKSETSHEKVSDTNNKASIKLAATENVSPMMLLNSAEASTPKHKVDLSLPLKALGKNASEISVRITSAEHVSLLLKQGAEAEVTNSDDGDTVLKGALASVQSVLSDTEVVPMSQKGYQPNRISMDVSDAESTQSYSMYLVFSPSNSSYVPVFKIGSNLLNDFKLSEEIDEIRYHTIEMSNFDDAFSKSGSSLFLDNSFQSNLFLIPKSSVNEEAAKQIVANLLIGSDSITEKVAAEKPVEKEVIEETTEEDNSSEELTEELIEATPPSSPAPPANAAATVDDLTAAVVFVESVVNGGAQVIDSDVTVVDDGADFGGGNLTVSYDGVGLAEDQLSITDGGNITVVGSSVRHSGIEIGIITSDGSNGTDLVIDLDEDASAAAVEELLERLSYANTSDAPTANRTIQIILTDSEGAASTTYETDITVNTDSDAIQLVDNIVMVGSGDGEAFSFDASAYFYDPDNTAITYTQVGMPGWMALDVNTGVFSGIAAGAATTTITITGTDASGSFISDSFDVIITALDAGSTGTAANDTIHGANGTNSIYGGDGDDTITTDIWDSDTIYGGAGNDSIDSQAGNDLIFGGTGNDYIETWDGSNTIYGGEGNDTIHGSGHLGGGEIYGGLGDDVIYSNDGWDEVYGGAGDDFLSFNDDSAADVLDGGSGTDTVHFNGAPADDVELRFSVFDNIEILDISDVNSGSILLTDWVLYTVDLSSLTILGTLTELGSADMAVNFTGTDNGEILTSGSFGDSTIRGGGGDDTITTKFGSDIVEGGDGNDWIETGAENDTVDGGDGNDTIIGGNNEDWTGSGDILTGGDGNDVFRFTAVSHSQNTVASSADTITDFVRGEDNIDVTGIVAAFGDFIISDNGVDTTISHNASDFELILNGVYTLDATDFTF